MTIAPAYRLLAAVSDAPLEAAAAAERLFDDLPRREVAAFAEAAAIKLHLSRQLFRDDPDAVTLPEMLGRRGGSCLGLTLLIGAELLRRGHEPAFELLVNPQDDVYALGERHFATLLDEEEGVDADSRLPDASDRTSRFRFVPAEHLRRPGVAPPATEAPVAGEPARPWRDRRNRRDRRDDRTD